MMRIVKRPYRTLNEIRLSKATLLHNLQTLKTLAKTDIIPVLKANAYGHGLKEIATMLNDQDVPYLAVDGYFEAIKVKEVSDHNVLVMGGIDPVNFANMRLKGKTFVVFNQQTIKTLGELKKPVDIHLEIDTGMCRHGVRPEKLDDTLEQLKKYPNINLTGVMSHLADADNPTDQTYSDSQATQFDGSIEKIRDAGFDPQWIHLGQSAGLTRSLSKYITVSRPGLALYGINPLETTDPQHKALQQTKPVLSFYSRPSAIQHLKRGDQVSYGLTFTAPKDMTIAVLPVGYYELLPRSISCNYTVLLGGQELPQVGRICMNHCMIDVQDLDVALDSEFELIGTARDAPNSILSICDSNNLFNYEFLVNINQSTRRNIIQ